MFSGIKDWMEKRREQREEETRKEKERRAELVRQGKEQLEKFRSQRFAVYIRERDGRKAAFESAMIEAILERGATVEPICESEGKSLSTGDVSCLKEDVLILLGTAWTQKEKRGGFELSNYAGGGWVEEYVANVAHLDYRLLVKNGEGAKIIAAGHENSHDTKSVARCVVRYLISAVNR